MITVIVSCPGISDLASSTVTLLNLASLLNSGVLAGAGGSSSASLSNVEEFLDTIAFLISFEANMQNLLNHGKIQLSDGFTFSGNVQQMPVPKRGILSAVVTVDNPVSPATTSAKTGILDKITSTLKKYGITIQLFDVATAKNLLLGQVIGNFHLGLPCSVIFACSCQTLSYL